MFWKKCAFLYVISTIKVHCQYQSPVIQLSYIILNKFSQLILFLNYVYSFIWDCSPYFRYEWFLFSKKKFNSKYVFNHKSQSSFYNTIFKYYEVYKLTSNSKHKTDKKHEKKKIDEKIGRKCRLMHKKLWSSFKMLDKEKNYKKRNISRAKRALCEIQRIFHNILRASFWIQALKQMHYGYFLRNLSYISAQRLK